MQYETKSAMETKKIAKVFAGELLKTKPGKSAFVVVFKGDLGAGKTTFIQGLMKGLGVMGKIMSPTFTLLRSYSLPASLSSRKRESVTATFKKIHHFDCYRIHKASEIKELGFKELIKDPQNIILVEWPERIKELLPRKKVAVSLDYGEKLAERTLEIK